MHDALQLDELLQLAERRALLARDLDQVNERMDELRGQLEAPKALPPARRREVRRPAAAKNGKSSLTQRVFEMMRKHKSRDWSAVELALEIGGTTTAEAARAVGTLQTRAAIEWVSRGRYRVPK